MEIERGALYLCYEEQRDHPGDAQPERGQSAAKEPKVPVRAYESAAKPDEQRQKAERSF